MTKSIAFLRETDADAELHGRVIDALRPFMQEAVNRGRCPAFAGRLMAHAFGLLRSDPEGGQEIACAVAKILMEAPKS